MDWFPCWKLIRRFPEWQVMEDIETRRLVDACQTPHLQPQSALLTTCGIPLQGTHPAISHLAFPSRLGPACVPQVRSEGSDRRHRGPFPLPPRSTGNQVDYEWESSDHERHQGPEEGVGVK